MPVTDITALAQQYGADVIVDAEHSWGQLDFDVPDLQALFAGAKAKEARLRALRDAWAEPARAIPGVQVLTNADPSMTAGITAFRIEGRSSQDVATALRERFGVFTIMRPGLAKGEVVRATPALFSRMSDAQRLLEGIDTLARENR